MERVRDALLSFGLNFWIGYVIGTLVGDNRTGIRAGVVLGTVGAAGSWLFSGTYDGPDFEDEGPIEIQIE